MGYNCRYTTSTWILIIVYPIPQKKSIGEAKKFAKMGDDIVSELQKLFDEGVLVMLEGNMARNAVKAANVNIDVATDGATMYRERDKDVRTNETNSLYIYTEKEYNDYG